MKVTVKLIGPFVNLHGFSEKAVEVPPSSTIDEVLGLVGIDKARPKIVTRNGRAAAAGEKVEEGDRVVVSPIYSGG
ncbi:MAG TPA: MoaD/ThiS family protein [Terriglobales bacterium]|nr:MoaD/ThiS family protein [Terriglobales bacterium]